MKKALTVAAVIAAFALTGCTSMDAEQYSEYVESRLTETQVEISDGRTLTCVVHGSEGLSCDWDGAN